MSAPSADWIAEQRRAEREIVDRYADLDAVIGRVEAYAQRAAETADVLATMPAGDATARLREANDLRALLAVARYHLANLDRIHLIEAPHRRGRSGSGGRS